MPSVRQRALATTDQPPSGGRRSRSSAISRWALFIRPCTNPADTGPDGRRPSGSIASVPASVRANSRASATVGTKATQRRSPNSATAIPRAAWAAAIRSGAPPSPAMPPRSSSTAAASASLTAATTSRYSFSHPSAIAFPAG